MWTFWWSLNPIPPSFVRIDVGHALPCLFNSVYRVHGFLGYMYYRLRKTKTSGQGYGSRKQSLNLLRWRILWRKKYDCSITMREQWTVIWKHYTMWIHILFSGILMSLSLREALLHYSTIGVCTLSHHCRLRCRYATVYENLIFNICFVIHKTVLSNPCTVGYTYYGIVYWLIRALVYARRVGSRITFFCSTYYMHIHFQREQL